MGAKDIVAGDAAGELPPKQDLGCYYASQALVLKSRMGA